MEEPHSDSRNFIKETVIFSVVLLSTMTDELVQSCIQEDLADVVKHPVNTFLVIVAEE